MKHGYSLLLRDLISICEMYVGVYTGRRSGNVASCHIEKGTFLLQEKPVMVINENYRQQASRGVKTRFKRKYLQNIAEKLLEYQIVLKTFDKLRKQDQDSVLELTYFYQSSSHEIKLLDNFIGLISGPDSKQEKLKLFYIFETHRHNNALYVKTSKFNHSCSPNAEIFTVEGTNNIEVKAVKDIEKGEEILINFLPLCFIREERRGFLMNYRNFDCDCEICQLRGDDLENDEVIRREFRMLMKEVKTSHISLELKLSLLLRLFIISKNYEGIQTRVKLDEILEKSFDASRKCFLGSLNPYYKNVSRYVAKEGLNMSKNVHGESHAVVEKWRKRSKYEWAALFNDKFWISELPGTSVIMKCLLVITTLIVFEDELICLII